MADRVPVEVEAALNWLRAKSTRGQMALEREYANVLLDWLEPSVGEGQQLTPEQANECIEEIKSARAFRGGPVVRSHDPLMAVLRALAGQGGDDG